MWLYLSLTAISSAVLSTGARSPIGELCTITANTRRTKLNVQTILESWIRLFDDENYYCQFENQTVRFAESKINLMGQTNYL